MESLIEKLKAALWVHWQFARQFFHPRLRRLVPANARRTPIIFVSQVAWDTVWQRPQEEALGLSRYRPVVFVSPVQVHEAALRLRDRWEFIKVLENGRLIVVSPIILSGEYKSLFIRNLNKRILKNLLRHLASIDKSLYMTNSPFYTYLADFLRPQGVINDIIDDFCAFDWAPADGSASQDKLINMTDVAFGGTGFLTEKFSVRLPTIKFLSSGVRYNSMTTPQPEPKDIRGLPRPRILYVGTLNDRLNADLFAALAKAFPAGTVIAVGPKHGSFAMKSAPSNLHFIGLKPHVELPAYFQHCDLGIMPFAGSPAARAINPIKTLEYLACGLPVLSTPVPDVEKYYQGVVRVEHPEKWPNAAKELLSNDSLDAKQARSDFARGRDWGALVSAIEKEVRALESQLA